MLAAAISLLVAGGILLALADHLDPTWVQNGSNGQEGVRALAASRRDDFHARVQPVAVREGQVVLYSHAASFPAFWTQVVIPQFEAKYGITVVLRNVRNTTAHQQLMAAAAARRPAPADVYFVSSAQLAASMDQQLLLNLPLAAHLPHAAHYEPQFLQQVAGVAHGGRYLPFHLNQAALGYDSARVTPSEVPQTLDALQQWAEDRPGKFVWASPLRGGSGQALLVTVAYHSMGALCRKWFFDEAVRTDSGNSLQRLRDSQCLSDTWRWMRRFQRVTEITNGNADSLNLLASGRAWMTFAWEDQAYSYLRNHQLPHTFRMALLDGGMPGGVDGLFIPAGARHVAAAALFIDFALSAPIQEWKRDHMASRSAHTGLSEPKPAVGLISAHDRRHRTIPWPHPLMMQALMEGFVQHVLHHDKS